MGRFGSAGRGVGRGGVAPEVLELRVHGVNNTPPHAMLEVQATDAEQVRGDSLGSFWTLTEPALAHARWVADTHHDHIPPAVHREAYWWGPMARYSPAVPGGVGRAVVAAVSRAGWLLLLPLGLANVAYWSRPIPAARQRGRGARSVRVFGLGLTLLLVTAVAAVSLDLLATQCLGAAAPAECVRLPGWLAWLDGLEWSRRLVVLSLVPVAALGLLHWLASASRVRYEVPTAQPAPAAPAVLGRRAARTAAASPEEAGPILARPGLWSRWVLAGTMARLHLAGGLALLVAVLAWSRLYAGYPECARADTFFEHATCRSPFDGAIAGRPVYAGAVLVGLALLTVVAASVAAARWEAMPTPEDTRPTRNRSGRGSDPLPGSVPANRARGSTTWSLVVLLLAAAAYLAMAALLWFDRVSEPQALDGQVRLLGLVATPGVIVAILFGIALAALGWRRGPLSLAWYALAIATLVACAAAALGWWPGDGPSGGETVVVAAVFLAALAGLSRWPIGRQDVPAIPRRHQAWSGAAPGVFLLLALGAAMIVTGLLVVVAGDWLNGDAPVGSLVPVAGASGHVTIPATYAESGVATLAIVATVVAAVIGLGALAAVLGWWREPGPGIPPAASGQVPPEREAEARADAARLHLAGRLEELAARPDLAGLVVSRRGAAALAHRAEFAAGVVAIGVGLAVALTLLASAPGGAGGVPLPTELAGFGVWAMAILWGALLVRVVTGSGQVGGRPLALVWDLMCFLPRSAHPFAPPCYAERAVPEIAARIDGWLRGDDLPARPEHRTAAERASVDRRRVVLSAHSLGAVLAVGALMSRDVAAVDDGPGRAGRVALVTYGTQLRSYFARFLPEFLGSPTLGTAGSGPVAVLDPDPWRREVTDPPADPLPGVASGTSLVRRLGAGPGRPPAWVNLWRRTDPLGFPVASFGPNVIDRAAEEIDATAFIAEVATHGGYPRTAAYRRAVKEVLGRLG